MSLTFCSSQHVNSCCKRDMTAYNLSNINAPLIKVNTQETPNIINNDSGSCGLLSYSCLLYESVPSTPTPQMRSR